MWPHLSLVGVWNGIRVSLLLAWTGMSGFFGCVDYHLIYFFNLFFSFSELTSQFACLALLFRPVVLQTLKSGKKSFSLRADFANGKMKRQAITICDLDYAKTTWYFDK